MTTIEISSGDLIVRIEGLDRFFACKSEIRVPLAHVTAVGSGTATARNASRPSRMVGTNVPGILRAGTCYERVGRVFWDVHKAERAIEIELKDDRYAKLVIEVADPAASIAAIRAAIA